MTRRLLARGDCVVATGRKLAAFEPVLSEPGTDKSRIRVLELDVTWPFAKLESVAKEAAEHWGRIDVLVNNAGIGGEVGASEEMG